MIVSMLRHSILLLLTLLSLLAPDTVLAGSTPVLSVILPRGVQRGGQHTLRFAGARLDDAQEIFLYDRGIEILEIKQVDANNLDVTINVAAECRLGEHVAQVRTRRGISDYRSFYIGGMPEINEQEPNNSFETPQQVEQNVTINGVVQTEDVDMFAFNAKQGQRLSIEIEAIRLGYMFDPFIALLNSQRFEIAVSDDTALFRQDGFISLTIPEDGQYFVLVRESAYGGDDNCRYRLHLGDFPRPSVAYPAGGPKNRDIEISFIGDPLGPIKRTISVPADEDFRDGLFVSDDRGQSPSPVAFRPSDLANVLETEPNDDGKQVTDAVQLPIALNGVIEKPGDDDYFRFAAKKDQVWEVECYARRIRTGLDPVIHIFDANLKTLVGDDDARRPDSYVRFTVPADGDYFLRVRDHLSAVKTTLFTALKLRRIAPSLSITIPRVDRYSQTRQQIVVAKGNRFATLIDATKENFGGQLKLLGDSLPPGITMTAQPMVENLNSMPVVFQAAEDAELTGSLVDFRARHFDPEKEQARLAEGKPEVDTESASAWDHISGHFTNLADFALGQPNNALLRMSRR